MGWWDNEFKKYAESIAIIYKNDPEKVLCCMSTESVPGCLNETYLSLVKEKEILPMEKIDHWLKLTFWDLSKKYSTDKKQRINISRSLYLLDKLVSKDL
jgi:hypothetical protein